MSIVSKILFACIIGGAWYHLNGPDQSSIAAILFIIVLAILFIKPIKYQDPKLRDEYRSKIQEAKARKRFIEEKQVKEKIELKKQEMLEEEAKKRELKRKLKI